MTPTKRKHDRLRDKGATDFAAGKPIDTFETLPGLKRTELERGSYEVGWRGAKEDARKAAKYAIEPVQRGHEVEQAERNTFENWFFAEYRYQACAVDGSFNTALGEASWAAWRARALL